MSLVCSASLLLLLSLLPQPVAHQTQPRVVSRGTSQPSKVRHLHLRPCPGQPYNLPSLSLISLALSLPVPPLPTSSPLRSTPLVPPCPPCLVLSRGSALPAGADLDTVTHTFGATLQGCGVWSQVHNFHPPRPTHLLTRDTNARTDGRNTNMEGKMLHASVFSGNKTLRWCPRGPN